ncbi:MAG: peptidoglycan DD-metalloendopeptidase family protein [Dehalococcoidia bacterium]
MLNRLPALCGVVIVGLLVCLMIAPGTNAQTAPTLSTLKLPLPAGSTWKVLQGYNGGTHVPGPEQYALDLVRDGGPTGGTEVVAPAAGSVWFAHAPGAGNGCASIRVDGGGGLIVQMCHIVLHRALRADERVSAGMPLGVIGEDGRVGNNGTAHLHLSMHRTSDYGVTRVPVPFSSVGGMSLEGVNLTPNGSRNQYACPGSDCIGRMVSTVGTDASVVIPSTAGTSSTPARPPAPSTTSPSGSPSPAVSPASSGPQPPGPLRPGVRAVVAGAGDCVNVRENPSTSAKVIQCLADGARLKLQEGPVNADGYQWWRLEGLGWAVSNYLSALAPSLEVGSRATISAGRGECLNVRIAPSASAQNTGCIADGLVVRLVMGPFAADGVTWRQLEGGGWVAGQYLTPES